MRTDVNSDAVTALANGTVALVQLVLIEHPDGDIALNTSNWNLTWPVSGGITYLGAYGIGAISQITDSPGEVKGLQFELSGVPADRIALALDASDELQGSPVTIRTAILNSDYVVVDAPIEWTGTMDTMPFDEDGQSAVLRPTAEHDGVDLLRGHPLFYSDGDQQALYPGDRAFEYVTDQSTKPVVWPSKEFFYK